MRILTAKLFCAAVHELNKGTVIPSKLRPHMLRHCVCTLVGRFQHDGIQTFFHGHLFVQITGNIGSISLILVHRTCRKCNSLIQLTVFNRQERCHNLGNAGRIAGLMAILLVKHCSCIHFHHNGIRACNFRSFRPVLFRLHRHRSRLYRKHCCQQSGCRPLPYTFPIHVNSPDILALWYMQF